jgi:hypothetical protein
MYSAHDFISELGSFFPVSGSEKDKAERFEKYANLLTEKIYSDYNGRYNYAKLLRHLEVTSERFPSIKDIFASLPVGVEKSFSGKEGETIKRVVNGREYEFIIVPNHWSGIMTIQELDRDIARRNANGNTGAESF